MKNKFAAALLVAFLVTGPAANAAVVVDTGPGPNTAAFPLSVNFWRATEFSLGAAHTITEVQGWIGGFLTDPPSDGTATAVIYTDGGEVPGTQLFAAAFNGDIAFDFDGPSGLSWLLAPGTYWLAFEVRAGQTLVSTMSGPSTSPLGNEASNIFGAGYVEALPINMGVRIFGDPVTASAVPEPGSLLLLGFGIAALG